MNLQSVASVDLQTTFDAIPGNHLILLPDAPTFTIIGATESFLQTSYSTREKIVGRPLFEVFPDNSTNKKATGVNNLRASLNHVIHHKATHQMASQRYDLINPHSGTFECKVWATSNTPVLNADGAIQCIIHTTEDITEKVRLREENAFREGQFNESEKRFRLMVEQAPVPILLSHGEDLVIDSLNSPMLKAMNKTSFEEVLGKPIAEVLPELKDQRVLQIVQEVQKTGIPFRGDEVPTDVLIDGKLERFYFNYSYTPVIEGDEIKGVLHIALDVTQQVKARKSIEETKEELQFVTDTLPQLVWATEANGYSYFFNKGWLDYTGLTFEDVKGNGWMQSLHPEDLGRTRDAWTHAFKDGAVYEIEYRLRRYDGAYRWFLTRGTPMKDDQGQILKWYGSTTDVHEQKRNAEALQESMERFHLVAKATQDAIWDWNLITDDIWWNEGFKELFGYSQEEIEPTIVSWYSRVHPADKERVVEGVHQVIDSGGNHWAGEYRFRRKDGSYATVFDRGYIMHENDSKPSRMIGSMQDITERKQIEEVLEQKVKERTAELAKANEELKRSNQNLEEFAYAASHDLKEPMRKIHLFSDRLRHRLNEKLDEADKSLFDRISHATQRMNTLIDDLLMYSHVSRGADMADKIDLNQKVNRVLEDLEVEIEEKKAVIRVDSLPTIRGHRRQLQQLFQNLISNAIKYTQPGTAPEVHIHCHRIKAEDSIPVTTEKPQDQYYLIEVRDNGIGFDPADAERIFNVFTRLHGNTEYKGTGVGLSIARKVAENHGGYIWAESVPGEGAIFKILLPA